MRPTTIPEKAIPSLVNVILVFILSLPIAYIFGFEIEWKLGNIFLFYALQILDTQQNREFRCFGMRVFGTTWEKKYSLLQRNLFSILYTASFATLFFSVFLPFDLFFCNMIFLQLPAIMLTGTTFHGALAGGVRSVVRQ